MFSLYCNIVFKLGDSSRVAGRGDANRGVLASPPRLLILAGVVASAAASVAAGGAAGGAAGVVAGK
jgi:hypothetical protein